MNINKKKRRRVDAKEEVIHGNICAIRKQLIHLQLEIKFITQFMETESENDIEKATKENMRVAIDHMNTEVALLLAKLRFYQKERDAMIDKKLMREYRKFPEKINMSQLKEMKETK